MGAVMRIGGLLAGLWYALRGSRRRSQIAPKPAERRRTVKTRYCGLPHLLKTGEPVAHSCKVLPADALTAEADGRFLIAARILARSAATKPLASHPGIWKLRRR